MNGFAETSGIHVNKEKSQILIEGLPQQLKQQIIDQSGFLERSLPLMYLGVPTSSKRLTRSSCFLLVYKLTVKIQCWRSRNISFAGRGTLIESALMGLLGLSVEFSSSLIKSSRKLRLCPETFSGVALRILEGSTSCMGTSL